MSRDDLRSVSRVQSIFYITAIFGNLIFIITVILIHKKLGKTEEVIPHAILQ